MNGPGYKYSNAPGRWAGFGPYYTMFPVRFAKQVVERMAPRYGSVLDPFCGRGTAPFAAQVNGRPSVGIDINPVAWVFARVKTGPEPDPEKLLERLKDIKSAVRPDDKKPENEFQKWAWSKEVLGFLNAVRRELDWRNNTTDRTLTGFILVNLHAKLGDGISNQMQKSRSMGPDYAVRWWKDRKSHPPEIDPYAYFKDRIQWRYKHGIIDEKHVAKIEQGDAADILKTCQRKKFSLLLTSPPYFGITDYRQDSWIRLWLLREGPSLPDWKKDKRNTRQNLYDQMLRDVFFKASKLLTPYSVVWIRTDARKFTKNTTLETIRKIWPNRKLFMKYDRPRKLTQTKHFANKHKQLNLGEVDFVMPGRRKNYLLKFSSAWIQI